ncbi:hypothetical protein E4U43_002818, partial [Claviceps pusilla]
KLSAPGSAPGSSVQPSPGQAPNFGGGSVHIPAPRQIHVAAASIGLAYSPAAPTPFARDRPDSSVTGLSSRPSQDGARVSSDRESDHLAERLEREAASSERASSSPQDHYNLHASSLWSRREPYRVLRISSNTHSAILFALEEALRHPNSYTPDVVEESSNMADLMAATSGNPLTTNGHGTTGSSRRPTAGPAPTNSPSGIRGPRMIMQERAAREARQRAEAEQIALEQSRAEHEARYWIRKLEQNKDDVNRDPLSQQLARQVTDLSAAGANLFHAVVELQRLRASSERKFQRWFFETRTELERAQEVTGMLEKALERERRDRAEAIREAIEHERGSSKAQKQLAEMRKELSISKEEARRAWEELGRREQEERDRTFSLQSGQPTIVGGVQVVPMTPMSHGGLGRQGSTRDAAAYPKEYAQESYDSERSQAPPALATKLPSPTTAGPSGTYYPSESQSQSREPGQQSHPRSDGAEVPGTEGAFSRGEYVLDATGNFVLDFRGQRIPFVAAPPSGASVSDLETDDYDDTPATTTANPPSREHEAMSAPASAPASASASADDGKWTATYSDPQDYSGQGYGTPGWETVPRHHHPTRLSDVIEEEDERSRTSATQSRTG